MHLRLASEDSGVRSMAFHAHSLGLTVSLPTLTRLNDQGKLVEIQPPLTLIVHLLMSDRSWTIR